MRYYIIAGEASGDLHGSNLMKGLYAEDPEAEVRFWGGDLMLAAASEAGAGRGALVRHYREGAVMGISDVLGKAGRLMRNVRACKADIAAWRPDVVILIDYPGFNFKIAEFAHKAGFKVFYYIAPKTWASREGRNRKLKKYVDRLFIVFPFEVPYFEQRGIPFVYKGNPLVDAVDSHAYSRPVEGNYVALLAGSRKGEISRMMPVCMEAADRLGCKVVIAGAPARSEADYAQFIAGRRNVELVFGRTYDILKYADAAIINSGTASLEAALIGTPQVVCWSGSGLTVFVARHIFRVGDHLSYISLGNLIVGREAFRELIQEDFTADAVVAEVRRLTGDDAYRARMMSDYADIRSALGGTGASRDVAREMIKLL
jgi:lipid-A-disaccharide synthase